MADEWKNLTLNEAQQRKYFGFSGWLLVVYAVALLLQLWHLNSAVGSGEALAVMFEGEENAAIMRAVKWIQVLVWLPFFVLAPLKHRLAPVAAIAAAVLAMAAEVGAVTLMMNIAANKQIVIVVMNLMIMLLFVIYMLRSKRVNLTYLLRERTA